MQTSYRMKDMRTCSRALLLLCLASSTLFTGCQEKPQLGGKMPPKIPQKLVSLSPGTSELTMFTTTVHLVGRSPVDDYPPQVAMTPIVVTHALKPDYEAILTINPDIIIYDQDLLSPSDAAKLKTNGNEIMEIGGNTIDEFVTVLYKLGQPNPLGNGHVRLH